MTLQDRDHSHRPELEQIVLVTALPYQTRSETAAHLTYHGGRYSWTAWTLRPIAGEGAGICVPCDLGAHWLTQHSDGSLVVGVEPFAWATPAEAYAAVERYEQQKKREPS